MHGLYAGRSHVRGCWLAIRADILASIEPLTIVLFSALTFPGLLHVCSACACSLPGCDVCRAAQHPPDSLADTARRSLQVNA